MNKILELGYIPKISGKRTQSNTIYSIKGISPTIAPIGNKYNCNIVVATMNTYIVAMRGRKFRGGYRQQLELSQVGICNCITTVHKDNLVIEVM